MLADSAVIHIKSGKGGDGCMSFRREKYIPKGGPDGGDGGKGGDVIAVGDPNVLTLLDFRGKHHWAARSGEPGKGKNQTGGHGEDAILRLPPGTVIYNNETDEMIADLKPGDRVVLARGGMGGRGNTAFATATHQTPRESEPGEPGEEFECRLALKLIADIGLVGLPNAGKSTFLTASTRAKPKVANYPFTTLSPQLGIAELDHDRRLVIADIPGLIAGASEGAGLGHDFLKHIERTRVLVHVIDAVTGEDEPTAADNYRTIRAELSAYSPVLAEKPEIIALNKLDLFSEEDRESAVKDLRAELRLGADTVVMGISGATGLGVRELMEECWKLAGESRMMSRPAFINAPKD